MGHSSGKNWIFCAVLLAGSISNQVKNQAEKGVAMRCTEGPNCYWARLKVVTIPAAALKP
eukprot:COSAG01_NODE_1911_length_8925_cov_151.747111_1_plen_60_part_00